ncbi:ABC transporter substrate-binding protein [Paraglaciecola sp.]|uniref:ABC transporter substrate-binding protein n=1 Tax=Paraglaciecola sp. TaxID=1920173 RepID=UPI003EF91413
MFKYLLFVHLALCSLILPFKLQSQDVVLQKQILFIVPDSDTNPFWHKSIQFMQAVAQSLNLRSESLLYSDSSRNRFLIVDAIKKQLARESKPQMIVTTFAFMAEKDVLQVFEEHKTPFITINTTLTPRIIEEVGLPREKYKYWLGHIAPDDMLVGKQLAEYLIQHVPVKKKTMIGLSGSKIHSAGKLRTVGLESAVKNNDVVTFIQSVGTNWTVSEGKTKTIQLLKRHKNANVNIIWTAGDALAEGAIMATEQFSNFDAGKNIWLGGVDWSEKNIGYIKSSQQFVSFGGHFVEGGIATLMLYDYINGFDFKDDTGLIVNTPLFPMTISNVNALANNIKTEYWPKIDFSMLSKKQNPQLKRYNFSVPKLLSLELNN